jgi:hypothetical protein
VRLIAPTAAAVSRPLAGSRRSEADSAAVTLGESASPTDVLLEPYGVDVYATVPSVGCSDSLLGCPEVDDTGGPYSHRSVGRLRA